MERIGARPLSLVVVGAVAAVVQGAVLAVGAVRPRAAAVVGV